MSNSSSTIAVRKSYIVSPPSMSTVFGDSSRLKVHKDGRQLWDYPVNVLFSGSKPVTIKIVCPVAPVGDIGDGEDVEIENLVVHFYPAGTGGTGASFTADRVTLAGTSSASSKPAASSVASS